MPTTWMQRDARWALGAKIVCSLYACAFCAWLCYTLAPEPRVAVPLRTLPTPRCPEGWIEVRRKCFFLESELADFDGASHGCLRRGELANLQTAEDALVFRGEVRWVAPGAQYALSLAGVRCEAGLGLVALPNGSGCSRVHPDTLLPYACQYYL